jgi:hypothetical protein
VLTYYDLDEHMGDGYMGGAYSTFRLQTHTKFLLQNLQRGIHLAALAVDEVTILERAFKRRGQCTYRVIVRRVRVIIVAVEKQ